MDNLTHTLVGATLAECVYHRLPRSTADKRLPGRLLFWAVAIVSNNFPDIDLLYSHLTVPGRLGYLLHHRGYTHTVLFGLVQGIVLGLLTQAWLVWRGQSRGYSTAALWGLALTGPLVHLGLDALNNYGVHPFWPVWNGWVYGDSAFILEPLVWIALFPVVYFASTRRRYRWIGETFLIAVFTAMWILPVTRWFSAVAILCLGTLGWYVCRRATPRWRADYSLLSATLVFGLFALSGTYARRQIEEQNAFLHPQATLHDVVLTPLPSNPLCWNVITVESFSKNERYRVRRGVFSPFPLILSADHCPHFPMKGSTAFLAPILESWGLQYRWEGQYQASVRDLRAYKDYACAWKAFLHFSRVPFLQEEVGILWAGDLRFDYGPELGFAELEVSEADTCTGWVPDWTYPRADIF